MTRVEEAERVRGNAWWEEILQQKGDAEAVQHCAGSEGVDVCRIAVKSGVQKFECEDDGEESYGENFAGFALSEPALNPGKDGAGQQDVEDREKRERKQRGKKQARPGDGYSDEDAEQGDSAGDGVDVEDSKEKIEQDVGDKIEREAQKEAEVRVLLKRCEKDGNDLPDDEDWPEKRGEQTK